MLSVVISKTGDDITPEVHTRLSGIAKQVFLSDYSCCNLHFIVREFGLIHTKFEANKRNWITKFVCAPADAQEIRYMFSRLSDVIERSQVSVIVPPPR